MLVRMMLVAGALILLATNAWAQETPRLGFKDIYLGMSKEAFLPIWEEGCRERDEEKTRLWTDARKKEQISACLAESLAVLPSRYHQIGSINIGVGVRVRDNKVGYIGIRFSRKDYERVRAAFIEKYGPPTLRTTGLGSAFNAETLVWQRKDGMIALDEFSNFPDYGLASIGSEELFDSIDKEKKSRAKKDADGL